MTDIREVPLELIDDNPYQDRELYEDIDGLGRIIATHGLEENPKARACGNGRYQLKYGHRRTRAFRWLKEHWKAENLPDRYNGYTVIPLEVEELTDRDMFDGVVIENVHRNDLKTTEKARLLKRYREQFPEATSEEVGLVFGMKAPTVRGMDIFLDLPKTVQTELDANVISQDTARKFHSMQRIAPERVIVATLKKVKEEKGNRLPEAVIEDVIERLDNVVDMWDENHRDGKPRSRYSNGWLLDMRNFPNKLLPVLTPVDAALALGIEKEKDEKARKLVEDYLEYVQALRVNDENPGDCDPAFVNEIKAGAQKALEKLTKFNPDLAAKLQHLIDPPPCTACDFYTKVRGSHFCGVKVCHARKTKAWDITLMEQASKKLGIAIYSQADGKFRVLDSYDHRSLFNSKDKGLRLVLASDIGSRQWQHFTDVEDDVFVVVATGDAIGKMDKKNRGGSVGGKLTDKEKAERRMMKVYRMRRLEMMWEFTAAACGMFDAVPETVLKKLNAWEHILLDDSIPENYRKAGSKDENGDSNFQRRALVWRLIMGLSSHYRRESLTKQLAEFQKLTQVKLPKALTDRVAEWDAEIEAAGKGVSTATAKEKKA